MRLIQRTCREAENWSRVGNKQPPLPMSNVLAPGSFLAVNQTLFSPSKKWELILQSDGNLVLYRTANMHPVWSTKTNGKDVMRAIMQTDGNFVLYTFNGTPVWASGTNGKNNSLLILQDDGNLVIYQPQVPIWASNTNQP